MRSFSKKFAFVLAAAMVVTAFAPAASAKAADEMAINKSSQILYVNEGINHKGGEVAAPGKGNVSVYDFNLKNKPADWKTAYSFAWSSSDEDVVTVAKGGVATAVGVGKATVYCKVTEKATKEVTTLKTKVTVKANAYDVEISNADKWDGATVEVDGVVDLNRTMYDEDGNKTTKRGTLVTDYTKWVAEPAAGVEINQKNGQFTFTDAAEAGEYKLYCYTYQSSKYTEKTAEADPVVVEFVKSNELTLTQNSTTKVTVSFDKTVKSLAVADVAVVKMVADYPYNQVVKSVSVAEDGKSATIEVFNKFVDGGNYVVKVKDFEDMPFVASVGVPVRMDLIAVGKNPSFVLTTNEAATIACVFYDANNVDVSTEVDAQRISYKLEKGATNGDYYLAANKLTIKKNTASAVVIAKYLGKFENGKYVGALEAKQEFFAEDAAAVVPLSVNAYDLDGNWWNGVDTHSLEKGDTLKLAMKLNHNIGNASNEWGGKEYTNGTPYNNNGTKEKITVTAVNPEVADISATGLVKAHKPGTALFYVNYATKLDNGKWDEVPFAIIEITVLDNAIVSTVKFENADIVVGTADVIVADQEANFDQEHLRFFAYDQRGNRINLGGNANFSVKCLSDGYIADEVNGVKVNKDDVLKKLAEYPLVYSWADTYYNDGQNKDCVTVRVEGTKVRDLLVNYGALKTKADDGEVIALLYEASFKTAQGTTLTANFSVTIQEPTGKADDNYIQVKANSTWMDLTRINNPYGWMAREEKTITFDVFVMNNGVIVDSVEVSPLTKTAQSAGTYQYVILKDGQEVDINNIKYEPSKSDDWWMNQNALKNNQVIVHPTTVKSNKALDVVTGGAVLPDYSKGGAGIYTFALYMWQYDEAAKQYIAVQQLAVDVTTVVNNAGEYKIDKNAQNSNHAKVTSLGGYGAYNAAEAQKILECFTIKDTEGKDVVKTYDGVNYFVATDNGKTYMYYVDYSAPANADYVYVKEIVFFEEITTAGDASKVFVQFVVPVDVSLENR